MKKIYSADKTEPSVELISWSQQVCGLFFVSKVNKKD